MKYNKNKNIGVIIIIDDTMEKFKKNNQSRQNIQQMSQLGKKPEEVLPYLLSGESDDLSVEFSDNI